MEDINEIQIVLCPDARIVRKHVQQGTELLAVSQYKLSPLKSR